MASRASYDKVVHLWNPYTGARLHSLEGHSDTLECISFSPDGHILASGSFDNTVCLWNTTTGELLYTLKGHSGCIKSLSFSSDSHLLASGSADETVCLWDTATGAHKQTMEPHVGSITTVFISPDGSRLGCRCFLDRCLWDLTTGQQVPCLGVQVTSEDLGPLPIKSYEFLGGMFQGDENKEVAFWTLSGKVNPHICVRDDAWVVLNDEKVLWLPNSFRPLKTNSLLVHGNKLAIGDQSGRVYFIGFNI